MSQSLTPDLLDIHLQRAKSLEYVDHCTGSPTCQCSRCRLAEFNSSNPPEDQILYEPEATTRMIFTCMSHSPEAVKQCLEEAGFAGGGFVPLDFNYERASISVFFPDDTLYYDLSMWAGHAFACGLISLPHIER